MEGTPSSGGGSGESAAYTSEIAETLRFEEEIQSLIHPGLDPSPPPGGGSGGGGGSSFTALLGLPANQAVELLHDPEPGEAAAPAQGGDPWRFRVPLVCSPTFPSNAALVERAARFSVFASAAVEDSPQSSAAPQPAPAPKAEPVDSGSPPLGPAPPQRTGKRKEAEKSKAKGPAKKSRSAEEGAGKPAEDSTGGEKLPYVHVRARRGQATDSHSLAERARREKINARMKLLQELVPGCSKISGTALVLDEIINHVQSLQRQVEFLSMRLAAVNPRIDFGGLDAFLSAECGRVALGGGEVVGAEQPLWPEALVSAGGGGGGGGGGRRQQIWHADLVQPPPHQQQQSLWERDDTQHQHQHHHHQGHVFVNPGALLFAYDSPSSVSLHSNQLKTEL